MVETISLDKDSFKALAGETRILILKELNQRQKTQSELAAKLSLSAPTVNEHLLLLKKAGLVQEIDDGHKWKYFSLSRKGKQLMNPSDVQIMLLLSLASIAFIGLFAMLLSGLGTMNNFSATIDNASQLASATGSISEKTMIDASCQTASVCAGFPWLNIALLLVSALAIGLIAGYLLQKKKLN